MFGFGRRKAAPSPQPAGYAVLCDVTVRKPEPGAPTGFFVTVGVRTDDEDEAITRARAFLARDGVGDISVESTQRLMDNQIEDAAEVAQIGGRVFYGAAAEG